jgi:hypothetical protein
LIRSTLFRRDLCTRWIAGRGRACATLCRIELPSSIEVIGSDSFGGCSSLNELIFASDSHLREIGGFRECISLCRIEFPSSVEVIGSSGFRGCTLLRVVRFPKGSQISANTACEGWRTFVLFEAEREQVKRKRDGVHLQCSGTESGFGDYEC